MRKLMSGLITATLLLAAPADAAPVTTSAPTESSDPSRDARGLEKRLQDRIQRMAKQADAEGCRAGRPDLVALAHSPHFPRVSEDTRRRTLLIIIGCTPGLDSEGVAAAVQLEPIAGSPIERGALNYMLMLDEQERAPLSAARRLKVVLEDFPGVLIDWDPDWFGSTLRAARDDDSLMLSLLSRLVKLDWTRPDAQEAARVWWRMDLARRQTRLNNLIALRDTLAPVDDPASLVSIAQDRRFAALWPEMEAAGRFNWTAVAEAHLARRRKAVADAPRSLAAVRSLMQILREMGRYDEAIAIGQAARDRLVDPKAYDDQADNTHWMLNDLAYAYSAAGNPIETEAVFREALAAGAKHGDRVSQPVNFSEQLVRDGRAAEALPLLQAVADKDGSPIGVTWRDSGIICAQAGLDRAKANALADDLMKRWEINPQAASHALLCLDRIDDAAALLVKRLASDTHRAEALEAAVIGKRPPGSDSVWDRRMQANRDAVWARPEVKAALEPVGRRIDVPYHGAYWGAE